MRELHVQDPWAALAYGTDREIMNELRARLEALESRVRLLEESMRERAEQQEFPETEPVSVGS
jgi:chaperonin cofactor prefoldin